MNTMKRLAPTWVEIDLAALRHNFKQLVEKLPSGCRCMAVVKSDAYGHGAVEVAKALDRADLFGVGTVDEGIALRAAGIQKPILLLLGMIEPFLKEVVDHQLTPVLYDLETATALHRFLVKKKQPRLNQPLDVHIKVDTGMTRLGILPGACGDFFARLKTLQALRPVGLMSHLAEAGDLSFTNMQGSRLALAWSQFKTSFSTARHFHLANSLATMEGRWLGGENVEGVGASEAVVRLGIALYGAYPLKEQEKKIALKPVMTWKSRFLAIKKIPAGTSVSYGRTFQAKGETVIGVIPVGYADGYFRNLSNKAFVLVGGKRVPVVGTVCMDMMMVDLTEWTQQNGPVAPGREVVLLGRQGAEELRAEELAQQAGTISYEVFCRVAPRLTRVYRL